MNMNKKRVLVTGGAGYIGAHTVVELIEGGYDPVIIDDFSKSDDTLLKGITDLTGVTPSFVEGNCADPKVMVKLFESHGPFECVLHFAAYKSVGESVQEPLMYHRNNIESLLTLLDVMKKFGLKNLIFSSSCTVYGQPDHIPVDEATPFRRAESPYGATKQICERILEDCFNAGYRIVSLRYFNPIGAHPSGKLGELPIGPPNNLVPYITQTAIGIREKLTVHGNDYDTPDGSCIRDYIHVVDVAVAHIKAMEYLAKLDDPTCYETFNLGTGVGRSVLEVVKTFEATTGVNLNYGIGPRRSGDVEKVYADPARLNKAFNWKTKYSLEQALSHAWAWEKNLASR